MAGYWTVADQHFATRQTEDVSIIRAARRSATCDGGEGREIVCNLIAVQNKSREDEQRGSATKEAGRMGDRLGQARPRRNPRVSFSSHSSRCAEADSTRTSDTCNKGFWPRCRGAAAFCFHPLSHSLILECLFPGLVSSVPDLRCPAPNRTNRHTLSQT